jgi:hypothetical protein
MSKSAPLSLTDEEFSQLLRAAEPLQVEARDAFLRAVASYFRGRSEIGPGEFYRVVKEIQGRYFQPFSVGRTIVDPRSSARSRRVVGAAIE